MLIECFNLEMTADEIIKNIPEDTYKEIKQKNEHPYFQAYSIIQNGMSKPRDIESDMYKPIEWGKDVISKMKGIIKKGLQFFIGHNKDSSTKGRKSIGEVISDFQKTISDKLHHIVIGYFPDKVEAQKYDVCSIEADILTEEFPDMSIVQKIKDITGIALGNSQKDKPAFSGAMRLGSVQAFGDDAGGQGDDKGQQSNKNKRKEIPMTFEEIRQAVKSMNIFPNQLFTEDEIRKDREFGKVFDKIDDLSTKGKDYDNKLKTKEDEIKSLKRNISEFDAHKKLENILGKFESDSKKLTDLQKTFINKEFDPKTIEEISDDKITEFVNNSLKNYSDYASMFKANNNDDDNKDNKNKDNDNDDLGNETKDDVDQVVEEILK